ncbi:hypothetical protein CDL12_07119 [Handroanthus impetiginosus]|uniref:TF-B3 domain-containing protein n=1 Tax=Handroanthus impetiginosus TaxID=429701 RepID=A0A2G9HRN1_9LAMI|nr:hypothetical protein CDL12_07119 [Handroanthus impetiginosus]
MHKFDMNTVIKASVFVTIEYTDIPSELLEDWSSIFLDVYYARLQNDHTAQSTSVSNSKKGKFDWTGEDIFQSGLFPRPLNPYFVTRIRPQKENQLRIPVDAINTHKIELTEEITLVDPSGREFHVRRRIWKDGTTLYTGGWKTLCEKNVVTYDDRCICEFLRRDGGNLYIHGQYAPVKFA